jgi:hypothetical protein
MNILCYNQVLSRIELVNSIVALLSIDFHALEQDVKKEQQLKQKVCIFDNISYQLLWIRIRWIRN